ncbi:MAG: permease [Candidatus Marinimicrobia bacterium]|nr:permease [Candidatus Neomarinimicrobiota bacterium]MCK9485084.1 permease [Candidatus Neomarinimicrobiota bacterium]
MNWKEEYKKLLWVVAVFLAVFYLPVGKPQFTNAIFEALNLAKWYAREHVLLCLVPAFFIAGVISVFISQAAVIKYLGATAKKWLAYLVASVSGTILAVCSCTILPLFSGIYRRGAGLGPAIAFLYSGPAINILAIILTARILGAELGIVRVIGAVLFSVVIGFLMHLIYRKEEQDKANAQLAMPDSGESHPLWQTAIHFFTLILILVFVNWGKTDADSGVWHFIYNNKWLITGFFGIGLAFTLILIIKIKVFQVLLVALPVLVLVLIFPTQPIIAFIAAFIGLSILLSINEGEPSEWMSATWGFAKQILPLLAMGVLIAGFLLGGPENGQGIIPNRWVSGLVGGNSIFSNFFASIAGAFMYFATLTEVPILQGLIASGMGKGPALALLLAGPALSLPNMLVIKSVIGTQKTIVYVSLVVVMATISGLIYGAIF